MASYLGDSDEEDEFGGSSLGVELQCSVCRGLFQEPVRLPCEHSFCSACIEQVFASAGARSEYRCPVCRESYQSKPALTKHLVLARLAEAYRKTKERERRIQAEAEESRNAIESDGFPGMEEDGDGLTAGARGCRLHRGQEVTHLCFQDWALLCPLCVRSDRHAGHTVKPLGKKMAPNLIESLEERRALMTVQILTYTDLEEKAKGEIAEATAAMDGKIDRLIEFLQNEKERLRIDIQHLGNAHLDSIHGLQAQATHRLENCESMMHSVQEASSARDELTFAKFLMDFMPRMETLENSPEEEILDPSLDLDDIPLPFVLQTWRNENNTLLLMTVLPLETFRWRKWTNISYQNLGVH
ncbi:tripartite motif-containing 13-like isoform X2 [Heptranchias perlo]|uniref:tripartite motif-containing 13-like isoform X2 n=1 Tax=Heptranchias perlo TaxID=212740 RepID=UPI0035599528